MTELRERRTQGEARAWLDAALAEPEATGLPRGRSDVTPPDLDAGAVVAARGAILLSMSLFLDWYGDDGQRKRLDLFEAIDLVLAVIAFYRISTFLSRTGIERGLQASRSSCLGRPQS